MDNNVSIDEEFAAWMAEVDQEVLSIAYCSVHDLPDYLFRDDFENGVPAKETASDVLYAAGYRE